MNKLSWASKWKAQKNVETLVKFWGGISRVARVLLSFLYLIHLFCTHHFTHRHSDQSPSQILNLKNHGSRSSYWRTSHWIRSWTTNPLCWRNYSQEETPTRGHLPFYLYFILRFVYVSVLCINLFLRCFRRMMLQLSRTSRMTTKTTKMMMKTMMTRTMMTRKTL